MIIHGKFSKIKSKWPFRNVLKKIHSRNIPKIPRNALLNGPFSGKVVGYDITLSADKCSIERHS